MILGDHATGSGLHCVTICWSQQLGRESVSHIQHTSIISIVRCIPNAFQMYYSKLQSLLLCVCPSTIPIEVCQFLSIYPHQKPRSICLQIISSILVWLTFIIHPLFSIWEMIEDIPELKTSNAIQILSRISQLVGTQNFMWTNPRYN